MEPRASTEPALICGTERAVPSCSEGDSRLEWKRLCARVGQGMATSYPCWVCLVVHVQDVKVMGSFDGWTYGEQMSPEATGTMTRFTTVLKLPSWQVGAMGVRSSSRQKKRYQNFEVLSCACADSGGFLFVANQESGLRPAGWRDASSNASPTFAASLVVM